MTKKSYHFEMTRTATTQNCAMFHKRLSKTFKTGLFNKTQKVVTPYQLEQPVLNSYNNTINARKKCTPPNNSLHVYCVIVRVENRLLKLAGSYNLFSFVEQARFESFMITFNETLHNFVSLRYSSFCTVW